MDAIAGRFRSGRSGKIKRTERSPTCPVCNSSMVVHVARSAEGAGGRVWRCSRYPTCSGTRPLERSQPHARRSTTTTAQRVFDQRRAHGRWAGRRLLPAVVDVITGGRRRSESESARPYLRGLEEHGFVVLHDRLLPGRRAVVEHLVVGPTGVFVVDTKPWPGQLARDGDRLYVDGRRRDGALDDVLRAATELQPLLSAELKRLGLRVVPVMCFPRSDATLFRQTVRGVVVTGGRALSRALRETPPLASADDVLDLALAADEMLEPAHREH